MSSVSRLEIKQITKELSAGDIWNIAWTDAPKTEITKYWNGENAPDERALTLKHLWSDGALHLLFIANQREPLVISMTSELNKKTMNLWEYDVVEIFIAPDKAEPQKYVEFEGAPNGAWLDVRLDLTSGERVTDWDYRSNMEMIARIEAGCVIVSMKIPWAAFGAKPKAGDVWFGNIFRCVGKDPGRGYLAWSPTMTEEPAFHVPERFGEFHFVK